MLKGSRLTRAQVRLDRALNRLEQAAAARRHNGDGLAAEIGRLKEENAELKRFNETVSTRLDDTIARLKRVLDT